MRFAQVVIAFFVVMVLTIMTTTSPLEASPHGCCVGTVGNVDNDPQDLVDIGDVVFLVDHLFITFTPIACEEEGEIDGQPTVDIGDLIALVDNLFISFTPLPDCAGGGGGVPQPGDLIFTELMIDPDVVADSAGEWFEVFNVSDSTLEMKGMLFTGQTPADTFRVDSSIIVQPLRYVTFARSELSGVAANYVYSNMTMESTADRLTMSKNGTTIDAVTWNSAITGVSRTLRQSAYNSTLNDVDSNWCTNTIPYGFGDLGTPGYAGLTACDLVISPLTPGAVFFSEFMPDPQDVSDAVGEWIELSGVDNSPNVYNLKGAVISRSGGDSVIIGIDLLVFPGIFVTIGHSRQTGIFENYIAPFTLPNTGTASFTLRKGGTIIDQASYTNPTAGASRGLNPLNMTATDNDNPANWCDGTTIYGFFGHDMGTPGMFNDPCF